MDIQPNDPAPRQRAEDPNQHIQYSDEVVEPEDKKVRDDQSPGIPGSDSVHCPECFGRNIYLTVVEPDSTPLYQCEQCRSSFSVEAGTFARGRQVPTSRGSVWPNPKTPSLRHAPHISNVEFALVLLLREFVAASNGQPSDLRQLLERILGEKEGSRMEGNGGLPLEPEGQPPQEPVAAESEATETDQEDTEPSEATDPAPTPASAASAETDQSPLAGAGTKAQPGERRKEPRQDNPFHRFWHGDIVPMLEEDLDSTLTAAGMLNILMDRHPGALDINKFKNLTDGLRGWLNRWREDNGRHVPKRKTGIAKSRASKDPNKPKGTSRPRKHDLGREIQVDFTHLAELGGTIEGKSEPPVLFACRLPYSGWTYAEVFEGETAPALAQGLQNVFLELDGVPESVCKDRHGSAIWKGIAIPPFDLVLDHYQLQLALINKSCPWENGCVERTNGTVKGNLKQILKERGSRHFASREEFEKEVRRAVDWINRMPAVQRKLAEEREHFRPIPTGTVPSYKPVDGRVTKYGWINLYGCFYSVPPGVGKWVFVRMYDDKIEVYREHPEHPLAKLRQPVITWPRLHVQGEARIDYCHVVPRLAARPTALNGFPKKIKAAMFPKPAFQETYRMLKKWCTLPVYRIKRRPEAQSGWQKRAGHSEYEYVHVLALSIDRDREEEVDQALRQLLQKGEPFYYEDVERLMPSSPVRKHGISFQRML